MNNNEIITLQFGHYSNFIGAHWWNIQESSFIYKGEDVPEISYDVLFREGENLRKELTFTPRLILADLKGSCGSLPFHTSLYEEVTTPDVSEDTVLWPSEKIQVHYENKNEKNDFLVDLENQESKMNVDEFPPFMESARRYNLNDQVRVWSDYLGTKFHPRTITIINEYHHNNSGGGFTTFSQGIDVWKTELFTEEWTNKLRAYAEECDYLQGFQVLFDLVDGFSGLSFSALTYLQDEYPSKSIFCFPNMSSSYPEDKLNQHLIRIVNSVLSFSELPELSSAFLPLCTDAEGWNLIETPRSFPHLQYKNELPYHSSAILAAFLDSVSMTYRLRKNITRLSSLLSQMSPCGRKLLSGTIRLPFPVYPDLSILESLEGLENSIWTSLTPKTNVTIESSALQIFSARGLSSFILLPNLEKRAPNPVYSCQSVKELLALYFDYCSLNFREKFCEVNSFNMPLKIPASFPNIFNDEVTRIGCISFEQSPLKFPVVEVPTLVGLHNCSSASQLLTHLHEKASKINLRALHQFSATGFEQDRKSVV